MEKSGKRRKTNTTSPEYKVCSMKKVVYQIPILLQGSRTVPDQYPTREIYQERTPEEHGVFVKELEDVMKRYEQEGTKGSKIKLTVQEESQFSMKETMEREIEIFTSSSLHPLIHSTVCHFMPSILYKQFQIISYLNPETSFSPSFFTSPSTQQLDIFFEVLLSLSSHSSFSHIPLIRILTQ